jgi:hypothetical protein
MQPHEPARRAIDDTVIDAANMCRIVERRFTQTYHTAIFDTSNHRVRESPEARQDASVCAKRG